MGSKEQAVLFSNQDYETLKQECLESGCLFEDSCFPAEPPSLGFKELAPYSSKTKDVVWMRPSVSGDHESTKLIVGNKMAHIYIYVQLKCVFKTDSAPKAAY